VEGATIRSTDLLLYFTLSFEPIFALLKFRTLDIGTMDNAKNAVYGSIALFSSEFRADFCTARI